MNVNEIKTYKIMVINDTLFVGNISYNVLYEYAKNYWIELGGFATAQFHYILGTNEILIEFMLTYPYAQYVNIKEIIQ